MRITCYSVRADFAASLCFQNCYESPVLLFSFSFNFKLDALPRLELSSSVKTASCECAAPLNKFAHPKFDKCCKVSIYVVVVVIVVT